MAAKNIVIIFVALSLTSVTCGTPLHVHFVNYATGRAYEERQSKWVASALVPGRCQTAHGWSRSELLKDPLFFEARQVMVRALGTNADYRSGYFAWKPFIILRELEHAKNGAWVLYSDVVRPGYSDKFIKDSVLPLVQHVSNFSRRDDFVGAPGVFLDYQNSYSQPWFKKQWPNNNMLVRNTSDLPRILKLAGLQPEQLAVERAYHLQASWSLWRKSEASMQLVREWFNLTISPDSSLTANSDQTWLTLLAVKYAIPALWSRSFGLPQRGGHVDPNELKTINTALSALSSGQRPTFISPHGKTLW